VAKAAAFWDVAHNRRTHGLYAASGILFNHESPLRSEKFVIRTVVSAECRIACGAREKFYLASPDVQRDWGWAPEYVEAMWLMLQREEPQDLVIATGASSSLGSVMREAFSCVGLDWRAHVEIDPALLMPVDLVASRGDPSRAREALGWSARYRMKDVVHMTMRQQWALQGKVAPARARLA
jgi:GDPmannose 4,6-dehydratase